MKRRWSKWNERRNASFTVRYNRVIEKRCYERKQECEHKELDEVEDESGEDVRMVSEV